MRLDCSENDVYEIKKNMANTYLTVRTSLPNKQYKEGSPARWLVRVSCPLPQLFLPQIAESLPERPNVTREELEQYLKVLVDDEVSKFVSTETCVPAGL